MKDNTKDSELMEKIVSLCKRRGFIFPGSEIYGGLAGTYDYGPLGALLKRNIEDSWIEYFVRSRENIYIFFWLVLGGLYLQLRSQYGWYFRFSIKKISENVGVRAKNFFFKLWIKLGRQGKNFLLDFRA